MPFYRNLGPIRFESQIQGFQIFTAQPDTTIFQSKQLTTITTLQTLTSFYQNRLHNTHIHVYTQNHNNPSIVLSHCTKIDFIKPNIDQLCKILLEVIKTVIQISSSFPYQIGDFTKNQLRMINGKFVFIYLPVEEVKVCQKSDEERVRGFLKLGMMLLDQSNMIHKLLLMKLSKCKYLHEIVEEINYFSTVYGVGSKSNNKRHFQIKQKKIEVSKKRQNKPRINLFKMPEGTRNRSSYAKLTCFSSSTYYSTSRKNMPFNITLPFKGKSTLRNVSNSCSMRFSPFNSSNFRTNELNMSFQSQNKSNDQQKTRKKLKKSKQNICDSIFAPVSHADQQKLLKKLQKKKQISTKKTESNIMSQNSIPSMIRIEKQMVSKIGSSKQLHMPNQQINQQKPSKVKFPKKNEDHQEFTINSNAISTKNIHKHQSIHVSQQQNLFEMPNAQTKPNIQSHTQQRLKTQPAPKIQPTISQTSLLHPQPQPQQAQPQPKLQIPSQSQSQVPPQLQTQAKKLKKKPAIKQQQFGSEVQIIDFSKKVKQISNTKKQKQNKINTTKQANAPKTPIQTNLSIRQQAMQTRKNSWASKPPAQQATTRNNRKYQQLLQKKRNLDYMGQTVVNTTGYLKNYQKIFWQLPLFFIYRNFYIFRIKFARQIEPLQESKKYRELVQQNTQIGQAVNKMAKVILKKLKKQDPQVLRSVKQYLNTDENQDCEQAMKVLLGEYIESLNQASKEYQQLMDHQIQVINSFLIIKGHKIDLNIEQKIQTKSQQQTYLKTQYQKLKPYL